MGLNVVAMWVSPTGCLVRLLKGFIWDLYGLQEEAAQKGTIIYIGFNMVPLLVSPRKYQAVA